MPSFRVTMTIGSLAVGTAPQSVLPAAARADGEVTTVEASDVAVVGGSARVTVRFTAEDETVNRIALHAVESTRAIAQVVTWRVTRRNGSRWMPVA
jgi:hypothetical protein